MMKYHAVLVNNDNVVEYIRPVGTLATEQRMLKYWKSENMGKMWSNSFIAKSPLSFDEGDKVIVSGDKFIVIKKEEV